MKRIVAVTTTLLCLLFVSAQDAHFSQFHAMPMWLNPAQTGFHNGLVRVGAIYRNQWLPFAGGPASYQTAGGFIDASLFKQKLKGDYFGIGAGAYIDRNGTNLFQTGSASLNFAYSKRFGNRTKHALAVGVGAEMLIQNFNKSGAVFSDGVTENISPNTSVFDGNIGLQYHVVAKKLNGYVGFAYHHLMQSANKRTLNSTERWLSKYVVHAGAQVEVHNRWNVVPVALFMYQNTAWQLNIGAAGQYVFGDRLTSKNYFSVGLNTRIVGSSLDAIIPNMKLEVYNFSLGLSYDINASLLAKATQSYGALEISLGYVIQPRKKQRAWVAPCPHF